VTFWNWRRGTGTSATGTAGSAAMSLAPDLAPIELYTADSRIVGWIAANGRRVTDLLNAQDELRLWQPSPGPMGAPLPDQGPTLDEAGDWQSLTTEQVILAMPPEWRASRQLRLHRKLRRVSMAAGPFNVTGNLHVVPGAEPGPDLLLHGPHFLPLTEAYILHNGHPPFEHVVSVVIVNTSHVTQMVPLVTLA
jgi:hypothetical protein